MFNEMFNEMSNTFIAIIRYCIPVIYNNIAFNIQQVTFHVARIQCWGRDLPNNNSCRLVVFLCLEDKRVVLINIESQLLLGWYSANLRRLQILHSTMWLMCQLCKIYECT